MMGRYPHFRSHPTGVDFTAIEEAMNFDIASFRDREYLTLSGGEKQRVHFARVLAQIIQSEHSGCCHLFLDEPSPIWTCTTNFSSCNCLKIIIKGIPFGSGGSGFTIWTWQNLVDQLVLLHQGKLWQKVRYMKSPLKKHRNGLSPFTHPSFQKGLFFFLNKGLSVQKSFNFVLLQ